MNKDTFTKLLKSGDFDQAEELLIDDVEYAEDLLDEMNESEFQKIEPHWSAVNTGEMISTPLEILKEISDFVGFKENSSLVDLGSGHGYPAFVFAALNTSLQVTGLELVEAKVKGSKQTVEKLGFENIEFRAQDLSDTSIKIPKADYYFVHNPFNQEVADLVAQRLFEVAKSKKIIILSTGGRELEPLLNLGFKAQSELDSFCIEILSIERA